MQTKLLKSQFEVIAKAKAANFRNNCLRRADKHGIDRQNVPMPGEWIAYDCDIINEAERFVIIDFERDMAVEQVLIDSLFKAVQYIKNELNN